MTTCESTTTTADDRLRSECVSSSPLTNLSETTTTNSSSTSVPNSMPSNSTQPMAATTTPTNSSSTSSISLPPPGNSTPPSNSSPPLLPDLASSPSSSSSQPSPDSTSSLPPPTHPHPHPPTHPPKLASVFPVIPDDDEDDRADAAAAAAAAGFECHICLDIAKDAVVSMCGHLFCWPCLHQWLETRPTVQLCPVCKAGISKDKVVPLYGRGGNGEQKDPRTKPPPPRPQGHRSEPDSSSNLGHGGAFGGWPGMIFGDGGSHLSFGIGAFPFAFFASALHLHDGRPPPPAPGTPQWEEERFLTHIFVVVAALFAVWLLMI